jgi:ATP-dependent protease ClpP protease subunit
MNQQLKQYIYYFSLLCLSGCADTYNINPVEQQSIVINSDKQAAAAVNKLTPLNQNAAVKSQAIINFVGKVTLKKTNDLSSYIHKQMLEGVKEFIVNINSVGGDSDAAISAYYYLKQLPVTLTTYNAGMVQSSAALLYCSGQKRLALPHAFFMLHGSSTTYTESMSFTDIAALGKLSNIHRQAFVDIMSGCSSESMTQLENYFSSADAKYLTAHEAQAIGLVQQIAAPTFTKSATLYNITD